MSGAAVWSAGQIIGLVAKHHRADGLGRLAATRVDRWYEHLAPERLGQLRAFLPALPTNTYGLVDVVPPTPGELIEAGYTAQVRDIAPEELLGRDQELAEFVQFCAGTEPYQWWRADAWAGKTALATWFVLHPPGGVTIVSFFVTGRLAGQADSDAFTEAMIEQLAAVAGESVAGTTTLAGRDRERRRLLDLAAKRVGERQQRLVLVIDGLDEDEGAKPGSGKPSIASLLPRRPPEGVRVLVTSRPHPGIPNDVPADHFLRHCRLRRLTPSPLAQDVKVEAKRELFEQLYGEQLQVEVIGFITAAGGGLTLTELAELTRQPKYLLEGKLGSVFGRSLRTRFASHRPPQQDGEPVYLFAHETLRTIAEEQLASDLDPYRERIDAWAEAYRSQSWPAQTPQYLLRPYGRLLVTRGDIPRLIALASDPARHDRMLAYTQGDAAALAEIAAIEQLLLSQPVPNLSALGRLAVYRDRLANRNQAIPSDLAALWVRLGQNQRGEALARSLTRPYDQVRALTAVATALAEAGQPDRALSLAADAEQAARSITRPYYQAWALTDVATALAKAGQWDRAEQTAHSITQVYDQAKALTAVATALAKAGQPDRALTLLADAEQTARSASGPDDQARALTDVAEAIAKAGQPEYALTLLADAEQAARSITNSDDQKYQAWALTDVAEALAKAGQPDRAVTLAADVEQAARSITDSDDRAWALTTAATALAEAGQPDRAEQAARSITDSGDQARVLTAVATALAEAGQWDRAEQAARSISDSDDQARALTAVATALAKAGQPDRALTLLADAEQTARSIDHTGSQASVLGNVARALAEAGQWDRAEHAAHSITRPYYQAWVLTDVATALAEAGQWDRAEQTAHSITQVSNQARALTDVAEALAKAGQPDRAEQTARSITNLVTQDEALVGVVTALAYAGQWDSAEQFALRIRDSYTHAQALFGVVEALVRARQWDRAEQTAHSITEPDHRARADVVIVESLIAAASSVDGVRTRKLLHRRACKLVAQVLGGGLRLEVIRPLSKLDPSGAMAIYEALHSAQVWELRMMAKTGTGGAAQQGSRDHSNSETLT
jgi:hypothetical protein